MKYATAGMGLGAVVVLALVFYRTAENGGVDAERGGPANAAEKDVQVYWTPPGIEPDTCVAAWLLTRQVSPGAEVRIVETSTIGIPFDVPGCELSRKPGESTSNVIVQRYGLTDPLSLAVTAVVRELELDPWTANDETFFVRVRFGLADAINASRDENECLSLALEFLDGLRSEWTLPKDVFTDVTSASGVHFRHVADAAGRFRMMEIMAGGGALLDYDGDCDLDVYLVNGASSGDEPHMPGPSNRLFRQRSDGTFEDVTANAGVGDTGYGMGCAAADYDNDGDVDLFVTNYGADALYRNNGDGTFRDVTEAAGIHGERWSASACFLDYDLDGHLDLFVASYLRYDGRRSCTGRDGRPDYCNPALFPGEADVLYRNQGDGTFADVSTACGIGLAAGPGLGVVFGYFNDDRWPDLYVANDGKPNHLWINQGDGTFAEKAAEMGVAYNEFGLPEAGMGVALGDVDGDGLDDVFLAHLTGETNTLYRRRSDGDGFIDASTASGLARPSMPFTGFGAALFDYDHDGDLDIAVANGRVNRDAATAIPKRRTLYLRPPSRIAAYAEPNLFYENNGDGTFRDISDDVGPFAASIDVSRALLVGDLDNDGDQDFVVVNCMGEAKVYRNDARKKGRWLVVRVVDGVLRRDAIGAVVRVSAGGQRFVRIVNPGYGYLSSNDVRAHFGLGDVSSIDRVSVRWPDGSVDDLVDIVADRMVTITRNAAGPPTVVSEPVER